MERARTGHRVKKTSNRETLPRLFPEVTSWKRTQHKPSWPRVFEALPLRPDLTVPKSVGCLSLPGRLRSRDPLPLPWPGRAPYLTTKRVFASARSTFVRLIPQHGIKISHQIPRLHVQSLNRYGKCLSSVNTTY